MPTRQRSVIAMFDKGANVRRALGELRGGEKGFAVPITILAGPEALHCCGLLPEGSDAGRLRRALSRGAVVMIVPATDPVAEKRISVTLLKHSRDSVHIRDLAGGTEDNEP